jgi:hypothetical protein
MITFSANKLLAVGLQQERSEVGTYWPDADTAATRLYPDCSRSQSG